ncbi:regulator of G-protein signaling loco isoform X3 [Aethina tumida]|uniref:regulator of G-protein signaling loco isoform X3 n=1 Tax=Aethina tumida TaxID=116153 RepID=UPI002148DC84|nr:regulator of G-protein signaling loco isoform X3 [Aethina tumida]
MTKFQGDGFMDALSKVYNNIVCQIFYNNARDGNAMGTGLVVALRPPFKRFNNSLRRTNSQRLPRRPASLLAPPDVVPQCEQNGVAKCNNPEGPEAWANSFEKLLEDPLGLHAFADFLKKEFSAENIYFWVACEKYRRLPAGALRVAEARRIYEQHLCPGAPEPVNVDAQGRQRTEAALKEPDEFAFDKAQKQILNLMKFDSYPRFLKSDIFKQCLSGDISRTQVDSQLQITTPTPSKLKKSLSNAEDRRRKSLLPWHRKNRSKSKDRGENEYTHHRRNDAVAVSTENLNRDVGNSDVYSSRSSLTSLDLAELAKSKLNHEHRPPLCRVKLSNGSTTVVQIREAESIDQLVSRLLQKKRLKYSSYEVTTNKHEKPLDINDSSSKLAGCEVEVEQRVVFRLDLPNKRIVSVKSKYTKPIQDILRPILHKYEFNMDQMKVTTHQGAPVDVTQHVITIDGARLTVQRKDEKDITPQVTLEKGKVEEINNQVFEDILQKKAEAALVKPCKSDRGSVKSEDWGSETSASLLGKFLRRDSTLQDRKKKTAAFRGNNTDECITEQTKKPLIAKWKPGVSKQQVSCNEKDELLEGLTKAQRRFEDQRGTEINFELPDFLKDKENEEHKFRKPLRRPNEETGTSHLRKNDRVTKMESQSSVYENRAVFLNKINDRGNDPSNKQNRFGSPVKSSSDEGGSSLPSTPDTSLNKTVVEIKVSPPTGLPPPLPPKPKIVPIKPQNWGNNGFQKRESTATEKTNQLYLEQPTSSFV